MLVPISNAPRDYAWGSTTLIAELQGREPSAVPEAEIWLGDHPTGPSRTADGRTLDEWLDAEADATGAPASLPYLLKILAAASPLSIQAHPSVAQAQEGFRREEAQQIPRDAAERTYRDANHKPELIVALSDTFRALAGLRDRAESSRLVAAMGADAAPLATRIADDSLPMDAVVGWVLSGEGRVHSREIIDAACALDRADFAAERDLARELDAAYPGDPGVVVALLMNLVILRRGEGLFVPAGVLHAYLEGLGVELMAASDNVLRGGLTPKHIDVDELLTVLDDATGPVPIVTAREVAPGVHRYDVPVPDFALGRVTVGGSRPIEVPVSGATIVVATAGEVRVSGSGHEVSLRPGDAVFVTPDEAAVRVDGSGEAFLASPGA